MWMIYPVAWPEDSRWQGRAIWDRVIVRAPSAAMARVKAAKLDRPKEERRMGNETLCFRSGLEDERLYWVRRLKEDEAQVYLDTETAPQVSDVFAARPRLTGRHAQTGQEVQNGNAAADR
ncbi:hypothetical protein [Fodinicurvata sediminis]|uniref:hypothetical protein n=1 Tax=Fodinicurvata sediminis TaxID=1121832 RepID=UPI0003B655A5|nr:hypothetical protein [Fodinicurvata sediminis]